MGPFLDNNDDDDDDDDWIGIMVDGANASTSFFAMVAMKIKHIVGSNLNVDLEIISVFGLFV